MTDRRYVRGESTRRPHGEASIAADMWPLSRYLPAVRRSDVVVRIGPSCLPTRRLSARLLGGSGGASGLCR